MTISRVLVANRGEIARRVFRSCRSLGIGTVAVFADPDADAPHVAAADVAVRLPGTAATDTYLRADLLIDAARRSGADAVHPGYGFLSENAAFARVVEGAGLTWIGPSPDAIRLMGNKIDAKRLMADAGVPVLPELDPAAVTAADLPVLIKAAAGGGGRGMRIVHTLADLPDALATARAEAAGAFGDPSVFCEPYLPTGHHVEVQILADMHGTIWTLGERECSIQRRHQKVIEEAPSPLVDRIDGMRALLFDAAHAAAKAIDYTGAGTVEFLADDTGRFFFLEMNTRLQVEHPVTECTTGVDLVARQLDIADGAQLDPEPPPSRGHAIEARLYAEDPATSWQPQTGTLSRFAWPDVDVTFCTGSDPAGTRLDSGVETGSVVGSSFDAMLAKVIAWGPTRRQAATRLATTLTQARIHGVVTNRDLLVNVLRHPAFAAGATDTAFFDRHNLAALAAPLLDDAATRLCALAAAIADDCQARADAPVLRGIPSGWRNVVSEPQRASFEGHDVRYRLSRNRLLVDGRDDVTLISACPTEVVLEAAGVRRSFDVAADDEHVYVDSALGSVRLRRIPRFVEPGAQLAAGSLVAPMPGSIAQIEVAVGERVAAGAPIVWIEAMKMRHRIDAPHAGVVAELPIVAGQQIDVGAVLAVVHEED